MEITPVTGYAFISSQSVLCKRKAGTETIPASCYSKKPAVENNPTAGLVFIQRQIQLPDYVLPEQLQYGITPDWRISYLPW